LDEARATSGAAGGRSHSHFGFWALIAWLAITLVWWALAFAPLPVPPIWLAEARAVCFGTLPNGLPEPWGWGGLIVSPLAMLGFLLAVWGRELGRDLRRLSVATAGRIVLVVLAAVPVLGLGWVARRVVQAQGIQQAVVAPSESGGLPASYPRLREVAPATELIDQSGARISLAELGPQPVLLTFAFAHCQTVCPVVVETVRQAALELDDLSPAIVVVTLDPWRDTPATLPSLVTAWNLDTVPDLHVLSGEVDEVLAVLDSWQMPIQRNPQNGDIAHPAMVHVLAPDGHLAYSLQNPSTTWVVDAVRRASEPPASG